MTLCLVLGCKTRAPVGVLTPEDQLTTAKRFLLRSLLPRETVLARKNHGVDGEGRFFCEETVHAEPNLVGSNCYADGYALDLPIGYLAAPTDFKMFLAGHVILSKWSECGRRRRSISPPSSRILGKLVPSLAQLGSANEWRHVLTASEPAGYACRDPRIEVGLSANTRLKFVSPTVIRFQPKTDDATVEFVVSGTSVHTFTVPTEIVHDKCSIKDPMRVPWQLDLEVVCQGDTAVVTAQVWRNPIVWPCVPGTPEPKDLDPPPCILGQDLTRLYKEHIRMRVGLADGNAESISLDAPAINPVVR